jgi:AcrR family transcriptional regulator
MTDVKRTYRQGKRAAKKAETRRRIVEAAVSLHGTVGPARTTLSEVAEQAGVSRPTLYAHFADEATLFRACTAHWMSQDPPPDPTTWLAVDDPVERLHIALRDLYAHYERNEPMIANVFRDMHQVPSMREFNLPMVEEAFATMARVLVDGFSGDVDDVRRRRQAVVGVAIDFGTWRQLVPRAGLSNEEAVDLMVGLVRCVDRGQ